MPSKIFQSVATAGYPVLGGLFKRGQTNAMKANVLQSKAKPSGTEQSSVSQDAKVAEKIDRPVSDRDNRAPLIAVLGAKGGVGASTITLNLAASFSRQGKSTTVVDGNLLVPDLANLIGHDASHSILELTSRGSKIDRVLFQACRMDILPDSHDLGALLPPADGSAFTATDLTQLTDCLQQSDRFTELFFVDVPGHLDRHLVTLLDACSKLLLVFEASISGVAACRRWLQICKELGYDKNKVILVINRSGAKYKLVEEQLNGIFPDNEIFKLPNASTLTWDSSNQGVPVVLTNPGSPYARALNKLSQYLHQSLSEK